MSFSEEISIERIYNYAVFRMDGAVSQEIIFNFIGGPGEQFDCLTVCSEQNEICRIYLQSFHILKTEKICLRDS